MKKNKLKIESTQKSPKELFIRVNIPFITQLSDSIIQSWPKIQTWKYNLTKITNSQTGTKYKIFAFDHHSM